MTKSHTHSAAHLLPSVCASGCSSEGTDGGTGDTLDTVDCCLPAVKGQIHMYMSHQMYWCRKLETVKMLFLTDHKHGGGGGGGGTGNPT